LRDVAFFSAGLYVLAVLNIAFQPVGLVFLPLLSRLCATDFDRARDWVKQLMTCAVHVGLFLTPQLLLFADVVTRAWLGNGFRDAGPVIRLTLVAAAFYVATIILRSAVDAVSVKAYNSRNSAIATAVAAAAAASLLSLGVGAPITSIAVSFSAGVSCLGLLTFISVHHLFHLSTGHYVPGPALLLAGSTAAVGTVVRIAVIQSSTSLPAVLLVIGLECCLVPLYVLGLTRAGVEWPSLIGRRLRLRTAV
jgi:O-antigen/teichoic acid export membrane protein